MCWTMEPWSWLLSLLQVYSLQRELQKSNYRLAELQKQMDEQSRREEPTTITEEQEQPLEEKDADK